MDNEIWSAGPDGVLNRRLLDLVMRGDPGPDAAYLYIPVDLSSEAQRAQYNALDALDPDLDLDPQDPATLHISLLYIEKLKEDDVQEYFDKLSVILPVAFEAEVVSATVFTESEKNPLVLIVNPNPALVRLQYELYNVAVSMGLPISEYSEPSRFKPHITVAYGMPEDADAPKLLTPFKVPVDNFVLSRQGYDTIYEVALPTMRGDQVFVTQGGPGSGHFGHEGRPGEVGGSLPSGQSAAKPAGSGSKPSAGSGTRPDVGIGVATPLPGETASAEPQQPRGIMSYQQILDSVDLESLETVEGKPNYLTYEQKQEIQQAEINRILDAIERGELQKLYNFNKRDFAKMPILEMLGEDYSHEQAGEFFDTLESQYLDAVENARMDLWKTSTAQAIALGILTPEEAQDRGFFQSGGEEWVDLPDTMYHVTTGLNAVLNDRLRSRKELSMMSGIGLGGGDDETISFTEDEFVAQTIYHAMMEAHSVSRGETTLSDLLEKAEEGERAPKPFLQQFMSFYDYDDKKWKTGDPLPRGVRNLVNGVNVTRASLGETLEDWQAERAEKEEDPPGTEWRVAPSAHSWEGGDGRTYHTAFERDLTEDEILDRTLEVYKRFSLARQMAGGPEDPMFFGTDRAGLAAVDPADIAIIEVRGNGQGYQMGALGEWRTTSGLAVDMVGTVEPGDPPTESWLAREVEDQPEAVAERAILDRDPPQLGATIGASGPGVNGDYDALWDALFEHPEIWPVGMEVNVSDGQNSGLWLVVGNGYILPEIGGDAPIPIYQFLDQLSDDADLYFSAMDLRGGVPAGVYMESDEQYAVSKSALLALLRGESLLVGPMRRVVTLEDGPFVVFDDPNEVVRRVEPPTPPELKQPKMESRPEPTFRAEVTTNTEAWLDGTISMLMPDEPVKGIRESIERVLTNFVNRMMDLVGLEDRHFGPGTHPGTGTPQTVHAPAGAPEGVTPRDVEIRYRDIDTFHGTGEGLISAWINDEQVGSLSFGKPNRSAWFDKYDVQIGWVVVQEEHRRKGIATQMMDEFFKHWGDKSIAPYETTPAGSKFMDAYRETHDVPEDLFEFRNLMRRHYGPGAHPGTGTPQEVHGEHGQAAGDWTGEQKYQYQDTHIEHIPKQMGKVVPEGMDYKPGRWLGLHSEGAGDVWREIALKEEDGDVDWWYVDEKLERLQRDLNDEYDRHRLLVGELSPEDEQRRLQLIKLWSELPFELSDLQEEARKLNLAVLRRDGYEIQKQIDFFRDHIEMVRRHYGPGPHPGTGTDQSVHAGNGGGVRAELAESLGTQGLSGVERFLAVAKEGQLTISDAVSGEELSEFERDLRSGGWDNRARSVLLGGFNRLRHDGGIEDFDDLQNQMHMENVGEATAQAIQDITDRLEEAYDDAGSWEGIQEYLGVSEDEFVAMGNEEISSHMFTRVAADYFDQILGIDREQALETFGESRYFDLQRDFIRDEIDEVMSQRITMPSLSEVESAYGPVGLGALENDRKHIWISRLDDGEIVGGMFATEIELDRYTQRRMVEAGVSPEDATSTYLYIDYLGSKRTGQGYGTELMLNALATAADKGMGIAGEPTNSARSFYEQLGGKMVRNKGYVTATDVQNAAEFLRIFGGEDALERVVYKAEGFDPEAVDFKIWKWDPKDEPAAIFWHPTPVERYAQVYDEMDETLAEAEKQLGKRQAAVVRGTLRRIEIKHYGPGPHPGTGTDQSVHAGKGGGKRHVGITSAKPGREPAIVFEDMRAFEDKLRSLGSLHDVDVKPGLGGWEGGSEPTWLVSFKGNGAAERLIAETAKQHDQDGVLILDPCAPPRDCQPVVDWTFQDRISPQERGRIESLLVSEGIGGWTWYKKEGYPTLRAVSVPEWGGDRTEHLEASERLKSAFSSAGFAYDFKVGSVAVSVMNKEGENSYDRILGQQ